MWLAAVGVALSGSATGFIRGVEVQLPQTTTAVLTHTCMPVHNAPSVTYRNQKYETRSPGVVPDFDRLHRDFDMEMTRVRSNMRRNITVPMEFKLNGVTPEDQHARDHKVRVWRVGCRKDAPLSASGLWLK